MISSRRRRQLTDELELLRRAQCALRLYHVACGQRFGGSHVRNAIIERMAELAQALSKRR